MKRYTSPEIVIVELEISDVIQVQTSKIPFNPDPTDDFCAPEMRSNRGSGWEEYEQ